MRVLIGLRRGGVSSSFSASLGRFGMPAVQLQDRGCLHVRLGVEGMQVLVRRLFLHTFAASPASSSLELLRFSDASIAVGPTTPQASKS